MKKIILAIVLTLIVTAALAAQDTTSSAKALKIATVNIEKVFKETEIGKTSQTRIRDFVQSKDNELQQEFQKLQADVATLDSQRSVLDPETINQRESELQKRQIDIQAKQKDSRQKLATMQNEELQKFYKVANPIIQQIGLEQGFTLILNHPSQASPVIYFDQTIDITDLVIQRINATPQSS